MDEKEKERFMKMREKAYKYKKAIQEKEKKQANEHKKIMKELYKKFNKEV